MGIVQYVCLVVGLVLLAGVSAALPVDSANEISTSIEIVGHVDVVITTGDTDTPSADEMRGSFHVFTNPSGCTVSLLTAVAGYSGCFYDINGGGTLTIDPFAGDQIYLNGSASGAGVAIESPGDIGDFICLLAVDADTWVSLGRAGAWGVP